MPKHALVLSPYRRLAAVLLALCGALAVGAPVASASGDQVLRDCQAGTLRSHYAASDYADALKNMPADADEYTDCRDQITAARLRDAASSGSGITTTGKKTDVPRSAGSAAATADLSDDAASTGSSFEGAGADDTSAAAAEDGTPPAAAENDGAAGSSDTLALTPISGPGGALTDGSAPAHRAPMVPIAIAFSIVILGLTRVLALWGRRAESASAN